MIKIRQYVHRSCLHRTGRLYRTLERDQSPALILWGEEDAWIPVGDAKKFKAALPQAVVRIMPKPDMFP